MPSPEGILQDSQRASSIPTFCHSSFISNYPKEIIVEFHNVYYKKAHYTAVNNSKST